MSSPQETSTCKNGATGKKATTASAGAGFRFTGEWNLEIERRKALAQKEGPRGSSPVSLKPPMRKISPVIDVSMREQIAARTQMRDRREQQPVYHEPNVVMEMWKAGCELTREEQKEVNDVCLSRERAKAPVRAHNPRSVLSENPFAVLAGRVEPPQPKVIRQEASARQDKFFAEGEEWEEDDDVFGEFLECGGHIRYVPIAPLYDGVVPKYKHCPIARAVAKSKYTGLGDRAALRPTCSELCAGRARLLPIPIPVCDSVSHHLFVETEDGKPDGKPIPGDGIIGFRERRIVRTTMKTYRFAFLDFLGLWNGSRFAGAQPLWVEHFGLHFHEKFVDIELPFSLVDEMKDWWSWKERDVAGDNVKLSVAYCRVKTSELAISAEQLYIANLYAPAIAFIEAYDQQQNVARVAHGAYWRSSFRETVAKNVAAAKTRRGQVILVTVAATLGLIAYGVVRLAKFGALTHNGAATKLNQSYVNSQNWWHEYRNGRADRRVRLFYQHP